MSTTRKWQIKTTQYTCENEMAPVANCLQYHTAQYGTIASFGWDLTYQNALYSFLPFVLDGTRAPQQWRRRRPTW